jgi:hypothetical protein
MKNHNLFILVIAKHKYFKMKQNLKDFFPGEFGYLRIENN